MSRLCLHSIGVKCKGLCSKYMWKQDCERTCAQPCKSQQLSEAELCRQDLWTASAWLRQRLQTALI